MQVAILISVLNGGKLTRVKAGCSAPSAPNNRPIMNKGIIILNLASQSEQR